MLKIIRGLQCYHGREQGCKDSPSFAEEVRAIMDRLLALDYDFAMLMFNSTDGYSVILDDPTKMGLSSQLLSQLVDIPGGNLNYASPA